MSAELPSISEEPSSSNPSEKAEVKTDKTFSRYRSLIVTECGFKITTTENYLKRLQNLRKELNYINETDWMYDSLDRKHNP
ncbi:uncharacterized protein LOC124420339 isoform X2 [Lucilia cuprina]|uniref:uncharacterized protein LOC124420339 isoform X2 n=1 Tax=Lucilia cuprina TaxID=7375 RepID=UPI001F05F1E5|nr:uncharacterized protein LOC124420339 isoform X2 [Lucilia cuprina]